VASEDVVYMLNGLGVKTGIDLNELILTGWFISRILQRQPASRVSLAVSSTIKDKTNIDRRQE
jgi:hydroxymethylglutaryl-CoA lyase